MLAFNEALAGLPYTFKFIWAPLMDRFDLAGRWRRRGWMVLTQLTLAVALFALAATSPRESLRAFTLLALTVAFLSASQDVVVDAYRTDVLLGRRARSGRVAGGYGLSHGNDRLGRHGHGSARGLPDEPVPAALYRPRSTRCYRRSAQSAGCGWGQWPA